MKTSPNTFYNSSVCQRGILTCTEGASVSHRKCRLHAGRNLRVSREITCHLISVLPTGMVIGEHRERCYSNFTDIYEQYTVHCRPRIAALTKGTAVSASCK